MAAVTDWRTQFNKHKIKKNGNLESINLIKNPDILHTISSHKNRPKLVVGFAAETESLKKNAIQKIKQKKCDIIIANNVKKGKVFGSGMNEANIINKKGILLKIKRTTKANLAKKIVKEAILPILG